MLDEFLIRAIVAIILVTINASIAGSFTIFKDVPFLVAGSAHAALAGAAMMIALEGYFAINPFFGAAIFAIFIALYAARARQANVAIGISFAFSMALAVLFISLIREQAARVWGYLFGDLLLLTDNDIFLMAIVTSAILIVFIVFAREFLFISFDFEGSMAQGIRAKQLNYLLLSLISISTVVIMKAVGAILVYAMLIAPAAAANRKAGSVAGVFGIAGIIALLSSFAGLLIALYIPFSPSAVAALIATAIYFAVAKNEQSPV